MPGLRYVFVQDKWDYLLGVTCFTSSQNHTRYDQKSGCRTLKVSILGRNTDDMRTKNSPITLFTFPYYNSITYINNLSCYFFQVSNNAHSRVGD